MLLLFKLFNYLILQLFKLETLYVCYVNTLTHVLLLEFWVFSDLELDLKYMYEMKIIRDFNCFSEDTELRSLSRPCKFWRSIERFWFRSGSKFRVKRNHRETFCYSLCHRCCVESKQRIRSREEGQRGELPPSAAGEGPQNSSSKIFYD